MKHSNNIKVKVGNVFFGLRNIEVYEKLSDETIAFTCDLYLDDILIGTCENDGKGGGNYPHLISNNSIDLQVIHNLFHKIEQHHYHAEPTIDFPYECDWVYTMDFLIGIMVEFAWYRGEKEYKFVDEK